MTPRSLWLIVFSACLTALAVIEVTRTVIKVVMGA